MLPPKVAIHGPMYPRTEGPFTPLAKASIHTVVFHNHPRQRFMTRGPFMRTPMTVIHGSKSNVYEVGSAIHGTMALLRHGQSRSSTGRSPMYPWDESLFILTGEGPFESLPVVIYAQKVHISTGWSLFTSPRRRRFTGLRLMSALQELAEG